MAKATCALAGSPGPLQLCQDTRPSNASRDGPHCRAQHLHCANGALQYALIVVVMIVVVNMCRTLSENIAFCVIAGCCCATISVGHLQACSCGLVLQISALDHAHTTMRTHPSHNQRPSHTNCTFHTAHDTPGVSYLTVVNETIKGMAFLGLDVYTVAI